jgi:hypothetical protein
MSRTAQCSDRQFRFFMRSSTVKQSHSKLHPNLLQCCTNQIEGKTLVDKRFSVLVNQRSRMKTLAGQDCHSQRSVLNCMSKDRAEWQKKNYMILGSNLERRRRNSLTRLAAKFGVSVGSVHEMPLLTIQPYTVTRLPWQHTRIRCCNPWWLRCCYNHKWFFWWRAIAAIYRDQGFVEYFEIRSLGAIRGTSFRTFLWFK